MRDKTISVILALVLSVGVGACGDADDPELGDDDPVGTTLPEEMVPTTLGDDQ